MANPVIRIPKARNKVHGRKVWYIITDFEPVKKEAKLFAKNLGQYLADELDILNPGEDLLDNAERNLLETQNSGSGKIKEVLKAMRSSGGGRTKRYIKTNSGGTVYRTKGTGTEMRLVNIKHMDEMTGIGKLESKYTPYHITPFLSTPIVKKRKYGDSHNNPRYSLWRLLEFGRKKASYSIPGNPYVWYTKEADGYSKWHVSRTVRWKSKGGIMSGSSSAYFILDVNRKMYKEDQQNFLRAVSTGVANVIKKRTGFVR